MRHPTSPRRVTDEMHLSLQTCVRLTTGAQAVKLAVRCFVAILLLATTGRTDDGVEFRTWTSTNGVTIEAKLVRRTGESVRLETRDGKNLIIYLSDLSQSDRNYVSAVDAAQRALEDKRRSDFFTRASDRREPKPVEPPPEYMSDGEYAVLQEMNLARTNPLGYAEWLRQHKSRHLGNNVFATKAGRMTTKEGVAAIDEAIDFLEKQPPVGVLKPSKGLTRAARDHATDIGAAGIVGHRGTDDSTVVERVERHGAWQQTTGENIHFGPSAPRAIVVQLIIDDGVPSRGHRMNIFNRDFRVAGVAIEPHERYTSCCVIDYAGGFSD